MILFAAGLGFGLLIGKESSNIDSLPEQVREDSAGYSFINPLLFTITEGTNVSSEYRPLKDIISDYADRALADNDASDISIYFRSLNTSEWISINEDETFSPASMLKVVTLIAIMREAETNRSLLETSVALRGEDEDLVDSQVRYPVEDPIRSGRSYTVQTLVDHLIIDSDNVANNALINLIGKEKINKTYEDMRLPVPSINGRGYTAEEYSHLFRALYNATYLSRSVSEKVLDLLSKTKFDHGLVAGIPEGTVISHKFGIKTVLSPNPTQTTPVVEYRELHDCGIVYYPDSPYFLCVMTRGSDFDNLEKVIQNVSQLVWGYLDQ